MFFRNNLVSCDDSTRLVCLQVGNCFLLWLLEICLHLKEHCSFLAFWRNKSIIWCKTKKVNWSIHLFYRPILCDIKFELEGCFASILYLNWCLRFCWQLYEEKSTLYFSKTIKEVWAMCWTHRVEGLLPIALLSTCKFHRHRFWFLWYRYRLKIVCWLWIETLWGRVWFWQW